MRGVATMSIELGKDYIELGNIMGGRGSAKTFTTLNTIDAMLENRKLKAQLDELTNVLKEIRDQFDIEILYCKDTGKYTFRSVKLLKYKQALEKIAYSDQCNRCDGCGYDNGCLDDNCALYIARKVLDDRTRI